MAGIQFNFSSFNPSRSHNDITGTSCIYLLLASYLSLMIYGYPDVWYRYVIHSHERRTTGRKNYEKSTLEPSSSHARSGGSATFQGSKEPGRIDISESWVNRESISHPSKDLSCRKGEKLGAQERAKILSRRRLASDLRREVVYFKGPRLGRLLRK